MVRLLWPALALAIGLAAGILLTAALAPHHVDPPPHYYLMETP